MQFEHESFPIRLNQYWSSSRGPQEPTPVFHATLAEAKHRRGVLEEIRLDIKSDGLYLPLRDLVARHNPICRGKIEGFGRFIDVSLIWDGFV